MTISDSCPITERFRDKLTKDPDAKFALERALARYTVADSNTRSTCVRPHPKQNPILQISVTSGMYGQA